MHLLTYYDAICRMVLFEEIFVNILTCAEFFINGKTVFFCAKSHAFDCLGNAFSRFSLFFIKRSYITPISANKADYKRPGLQYAARMYRSMMRP